MCFVNMDDEETNLKYILKERSPPPWKKILKQLWTKVVKKTKRIKYLKPRTGIVHTIKKGGCVHDTWILLDK